MDLRDIISGNRGQEFLWSLIVEPGWVQAGIWTIHEDEAKVISISNPVPWETNEELAGAADSALSSAVQSLPEDASEPNKVVFGVPASWVVDGAIKADRLESLKTICSKLSLTPSGFVTLPEAISFYIKSVEGSPLTAVTISPSRELIEVSVFRLGNLLGTTQVARSVSIFEDVVEGLSRFRLQDPVPSRFILFDGKEGELEDAKQALINGNWHELSGNSTAVKILHTPKIELLSSEKKIEAVSLGGATELAKVSKVNLMGAEPKLQPQDSNIQNLGFVVDDNEKNEKVDREKIDDTSENVEDQTSENPKTSKNPLPVVIAKIKRSLHPLSEILAGGRKPVIVGAVSVVLVVVALFVFWWFYPKATVAIFVAPQKLDEKVSVSVAVNSTSVDLEKRTIPGAVVETSETGEKTTSTSGSKLVGEKAKGEVEIRNGTSDNLDLKSGTLLIASNSLEFVISKDANISAQTSPGEPGSGKVEVTAGDIGPEYNLPKDERFKVGNYPKAEVDAVATADFSGGASRQIQAISQDDRDRVLEELTNELTQKAKDLLKTEAKEGEFFIEGSIIATTSDEIYSGKVGDESDTLKLSMKVNIKGVTVSKDNLFNLASEVLKANVPDGYILRSTQVEYEFELKEFKDKENIYVLEGKMSANLLPEINTDEIKNNIVGKYKEVAQDYLSKIPGYSRVQITLSPRFPGRLGTLPHVVDRIFVEIEADR